MAFANYKFVDIFRMLHDKENKRFYGSLVLITLDSENFPCALSDEAVRYGTDDYELFEKAVRKDFSPYVAEQILNNEFTIDIDRPSYVVALDTGMSYYESENSKEQRTLYVNAYPKNEYEETKMYKSGRCSPFSLFGF
jgi:hypothetical protein